MSTILRSIRIMSFAALIICATCCDCKKIENTNDFDRVLILYEAGFNSLSSDLIEDIDDVKGHYLPLQTDRNAVVVISQFPTKYLSYKTVTDVSITRLYKDRKGSVIADTLFVMPAGSICTKADDFKKALQTVQVKLKSDHYGLLFSSHGSGWIPSGYYNEPEETIFSLGPKRAPRKPLPEGAVPYYENDEFPGLPRTKSIGQTVVGGIMDNVSYEIDIKEFAQSIPMHLDYILFDACLMANVEVAYELKDVCDVIAASSAEVMSKGFDYTTLCERLVKSNQSYPKMVCEDYYHFYESQTGLYNSATISLIDCSKLDAVANACKTIFENHRSELEAIDYTSVQRFYRSYHRWYFDLEDMVAHCSPTAAEKKAFDDAMAQCIIYKAATPAFMGGGDYENSAGFYIHTHSGLTSYLPCAIKNDKQRKYLDDFYKELAWNRATSLVK